jgi:parallel beta-helix repeat protein
MDSDMKNFISFLMVLLLAGFTGSATITVNYINVPGPSPVLYANPYYGCTRNFYVATTGSDSNTATQAQSPSTPWLTIAKYNGASGFTPTAGDCINVASGTYAAGVSVTHGGNNAASNGYIVYRCQTLNGCTVTDPGNNGNTHAAFDLAANYVMIDGFILNGGAGTTTFTNGVGSCVNNNCGFGAGSVLFGFHHLWVTNNIISGYGQAGAGLCNGEYFYTIHNTIFNNSHDCQLNAQGSNISYYLPVAIASYSPTSDDGNNPVTGNTGSLFRQFVMWNVLYNSYICSGSTVGVTDGNGFIADDWAGDQFGATGLQNYLGGGLVAFNVSYNNGMLGIHLFASQYITVANNSVYNNAIQPGNTNATARGGIDDNSSYGNNFINNISYAIVGGSAPQSSNSAMGIYGLFNYAASTTLTAAVTSTSQTSISISSAAQFPNGSTFNASQVWNGSYALPGGNMIQIDNEYMQVTAGWNTTTWTVIRGVMGTTAATHGNGATVQWQQEYYSDNILYATVAANATDIQGGSTANLPTTTILAFLNNLTSLPGWVNVGNTSSGSQSTQPNGANFSLANGSAAIGFSSIAAPFNFLPSATRDAGACDRALTTCP